jgi:MFS family permease
MGASVAYVILAGVIGYWFRRTWRRVSGDPCTPALERRNRRTMAAAAIYAVLLLAVVWLHAFHPVQGALAYVLAVLPAIAVVGMVVAMGLYFREETDEFERSIRIENALWATGGTLAIATVWGFAELLAGAPHVGAWIWFPVWALFGSVADFFIRRRYR